jgi:hypothetical protein
MRELTTNLQIPLSLTLAADSRLATTNYLDDQIWELTFNLGEPPGLTLQTTYGLRATKMRIFPRFVEGHSSISDPRKFTKIPVVSRYYPNYIDISYAPFEEIEVRAEYWARSSNLVAGRINIENKSPKNRKLRFEWVALLIPIEGDQRIVPQKFEAVHGLVGSCEEISPVVFISGGASSVASPFPALVFDLDLPPGKYRQFTWSQAALKSADESFALAHDLSSLNWEAEIARIELTNSSQIEIFTGNSDWDSAFDLAQKNALNLFLAPTKNLPHTSFVKSRRPDHGFSRSGSGSEYGPLWNGQTPIDAFHLAGIILPSETGLAEGLLLNFLTSETEANEVDLKPGLGGQLSNRLATPILVSLAWRIYQFNEDLDFLRKVFPPLLKFFRSWFTQEHDRDGDGVPEWDHPLQTGFEENPLFARWRPTAQAIDITKSESPSLCSFLFHECRILIRIAKLTNQLNYLNELNTRAETLRSAVENSWIDELHSYVNWDRDSHISSNQLSLGELKGAGMVEINQDFPTPVRVVIRIKTKEETTRKSQINIHGMSPSGQHRVENIKGDRILWFPGWGSTTSEQIYSTVEFVEILGINPSDDIIITSAGFINEDITSLLPIWAQIPSAKRVKSIADHTLFNSERYWRKFGLPVCPDMTTQADHVPYKSVNVQLCNFIGEGLLKYGYRDEAAELVTRIMSAITQTLDQEGNFREYYDADTGQGLGEINEIVGLPPLGLFLNTLGIRLKSPWRIGLSGYNPYPWPVTVKYRGATILRGLKKTQIIFPDGQNVTIDDPDPQIISMEKNAH